MPKIPPQPLTPPTIRQLPLPFPMAERLPPQPPALPVVTQEQVWPNLPSATRAQVRAILLSVIQEVLNEPCHP